jgi:CRISPR/Cas system-associated exonuclease Cas4 (RecB family)
MIDTRSPPSRKPAGSRDYLSYSAISLYSMCSLRYFFRYHACLPEDFISANLVFGAGIHAALQLHFQELLARSSAPPRDKLLDAFWAEWNRHDPKTIRFNRGEGVDAVGRLAERMLFAFQSSRLAVPAGTILGVEEEMRGVLVPGLPDLLARVDLIVETDEAVIVTDHKTASRAWSPEHVEDAAGQLLLYRELVTAIAGNKPIRLQFAIVTKTTVPVVIIHEVPVTREKVERTKKIVERVWRAIEEQHYFPSPSPMNCPGCPYRKACRAWRG